VDLQGECLQDRDFGSREVCEVESFICLYTQYTGVTVVTIADRVPIISSSLRDSTVFSWQLSRRELIHDMAVSVPEFEVIALVV
jgi:hypothetical protein